MLVGKTFVGQGRCLLLLQRALAGVLDRQDRDDDEHVEEAPKPVGFDDHPRQARVHGQEGNGLPVCREPPPRVGPLPLFEGSQLLQQPHPVGDVPIVGRVDERERGHLAQPEGGHLEDDRGEVGPQDLGVGEVRPSLEVLFGVEPDADPVGQAPAPPGALAGAGLGDRLDRQPLHLGPLAVARDPGRARVDDVADAGDGQRGLGDVGGQDHPAALMAGEDPMLVGRREPAEERDDLGAGKPQPGQCVCGVTDLAFAGEEDEDVVGRDLIVVGGLGPQLFDRLADAGHLIHLDGWARGAVLGRQSLAHQRPVAHLDRIGPSGHLDDRRRVALGVGEVLGELPRVDGRRRDDDLEVRPPRQQLLEVAEDEVDVEAALMRLVDDDRVVAAQFAVPLHLRQQDAVGHHLDERVAAGLVGEAHLIADDSPELDPELLGEPLPDCAGGDPPRLGVADHAVDAAPEFKKDLRQLSRLARPSLARDDDDLVVADRGGDVVATGRNGQVVGIGDRGDRLAAPRIPLSPCLPRLTRPSGRPRLASWLDLPRLARPVGMPGRRLPTRPTPTGARRLLGRWRGHARQDRPSRTAVSPRFPATDRLGHLSAASRG